jgi:hypothetical protein
MKQLAGLVTGFSGGLLGGCVGIGGGVVMVPLMTHFLKLTQHQAHGASLMAIIFTASIGAATYSINGDVNWEASLLIAASAIFTARFGALFAHSLPEKKLKKIFGLFLALASFLLLIKGHLPVPGLILTFWAKIFVFLAIGVLTGFISGMMGVGGGAVMVPLMVILANMGQHIAQGTSLLAMIPVSISGSFVHYKLGNIRNDVVWGLAIGSLIGGFLGASFAKALPELYLRCIFAGVGFWMSIR